MINSSLSVDGKITTVKIEKNCGNHSVMSIDIVPHSLDEIPKLLSFINIGDSIDADINGGLVMCGKIVSASGKITYSGAAVTVKAVSYSIESDIAKTSRVFQSPEKKYKDIFDKISDSISFKVNKDDIASKVEPEVIIQHNETDFAFANRIACDNKTRVFVCDCVREHSEIVIADDLNKTQKLENSDIISLKMDISAYAEVLEIEYREYIELGTKVTIENNEYVIIGLTAEYRDDNDRFFYRLERIIKPHEVDANILNVISLGTAKVTDNKDPDNLGRLQVSFTELEDALDDKKIWIQYVNTLTAKEGGVFFIPDVDELVQVLYQNGYCYAYGCKRQVAASEKINNTDNKSIMLYEKTLVIEDKKITLIAGDYTVEVNEDELFIKNQDYSMTMSKDSIVAGNSKNTVTIDKDKVEIDLNGKGTVTVKESFIAISANNKGKVEISDKDVSVSAGESKMKLESKKLSVNASSSVDITTTKMNVK